MKSRSILTLATAAACLSFTASSDAAIIIVAENFGGLSSDDLNATSADTFAAGITTAGGSSTWAAKTTDYRADGSVVGTGATTNRAGSASLDLGSYINNSKGTSTGKFELTVTVTALTGQWMAIGFAQQENPNTLRNFTNTDVGSTGGTSTTGYGNMLYRSATGGSPAGDIDQFAGSITNNPVAADDVVFTGARTLTLTLDLTALGGYNGTSNFGTVSFADSVAGTFGSYTYTTDVPIGSILLSWSGTTAAGNATGSYANLTLTQIPEPGAALLGGLGLLALLRRRRG